MYQSLCYGAVCFWQKMRGQDAPKEERSKRMQGVCHRSEMRPSPPPLDT
jgi:hypothetical protein